MKSMCIGYGLLGVIGVGGIALLAGCGEQDKGPDASNSSPAAAQTTGGGSTLCAENSQRFKAAFDKSQYARTLHLSAVDILDMKDAGVEPGKAIHCEMTFLLNNGEKKAYRFSITPAPAGGFHLTGEPIESAESAALATQVEEILDVSVQRKEVAPGEYLDRQVIVLQLRNKGSKGLSGIKGLVVFRDLFDEEVAAVSFSYTDPIAPGQATTWAGFRDYNEAIPPHRAFAALEQGKYKTRFEPEIVLFSDGTKLQAPRRKHSYDVMYDSDFKRLPQ